MNKSLIYLYFLHKRKKIIKSKTNLNEINICFKKTFKNCNSIRNKKIWRLVHFITPFTGNIRLVYICVF